jgi:hypothetical protein
VKRDVRHEGRLIVARMSRAWQVVTILAFATTSAHAQAPTESVPPPIAEAPPPISPPMLTAPMQPRYLEPPELRPGDSDYRSPLIALELSLGLTVLGYGLSSWAQYKQNESYSPRKRLALSASSGRWGRLSV